MEDISNTQSVYHPRRPYDSPLWKLLNNHYENFERCYEERFEQKYGFFRPIVREVVRNYLTLQNVIGLQDGVPGVVFSLHTFGDYPEKFHPHIHALETTMSRARNSL